MRNARILVLGWLAFGAGCAFNPGGPLVQDHAELAQVDPASIPEADLLDIDIRPFKPLGESFQMRLRALEAGDGLFGVELPNTRTLRQAEGHYLSRELANKLEGSGYWGLVRLNPYGMSGADLEVTGTILDSDGLSLRIRVNAHDSRGELWLSRTYTQLSPSAPMDGDLNGLTYPFADIFNAIANDLVAARARMLLRTDAATLRQYSELKFAAALAPNVYAPYQHEGEVLRLPAHDDPLFQVVQEMRARNETFLDAMQLSYDLYVDQIERNYLRFLYQSQQVSYQLQDYMLRGRARPELLLQPSGRYSDIYERALADFVRPLEEAVAPVMLEFNGHTTKLNGTIENQFRQWQVILLDMYEMEVGVPTP